MRFKKGFTLVEILITLAIIALLIAVIIAGIDAIRSKGRDARRLADIKQLQGAIENYFDSCYDFPTNLSALAVPDCNGNTYIVSIPEDPDQSKSYSYFKVDNPKRFHLCAELEFSFGNNKGKAGEGPFDVGDFCDGGNEFVFDVVGGAYGD